MCGNPTMPVPAIHAPEHVPEASLLEVFSSIQGEGTLLGYRQIFIRFCGCNLNCAYCDTPFNATDRCRVEVEPASGMFESWENPVNIARIMDYSRNMLERHPHHSFALTGGEPLQHIEVLQGWLPQLRQLLPLQLETNGTLVPELSAVLPYLDWVVMDIKLESQTGAPTPWERHREFLKLAMQVQCCVKLVVGDSVTDPELGTAATLIAATAPDVDVILQPRTIQGRCGIQGEKLLHIHALFNAHGLNTRVIPQTHHFMQLL